MGSAIWTNLQASLVDRLEEEDDRDLWEAALEAVFHDAESLLVDLDQRAAVRTEIGRCSRWLRPHQTRWTADGGFAWPSGYGGVGQNRQGLPEFDWSCTATWRRDDRCWQSTPHATPDPSKTLLFRVAIPARTVRHEQAALHTIWIPGPPQHRGKQLTQFYGLRKTETGWVQTGYDVFPNGRAYEIAGGDGESHDAD